MPFQPWFKLRLDWMNENTFRQLSVRATFFYTAAVVLEWNCSLLVQQVELAVPFKWHNKHYAMTTLVGNHYLTQRKQQGECNNWKHHHTHMPWQGAKNKVRRSLSLRFDSWCRFLMSFCHRYMAGYLPLDTTYRTPTSCLPLPTYANAVGYGTLDTHLLFPFT